MHRLSCAVRNYALFTLLMLRLGATCAHGQIVAYEFPAGEFSDFTSSESLGLDFRVNVPIFVTSLGAYDLDQDGLLGAITLEIWRRDDAGTPDDVSDDFGVEVATAATVQDVQGTLIGGSRFVDLPAPVELAPGDYTISAFGFDQDPYLNYFGDPVGTTNDGEFALTFVGQGRFGLDTGFPEISDCCVPNSYGAGTFQYFADPDRIIGDVNGDGQVLLDDYDVIRQNFFEEGVTGEEGDLDFNGIVNFTDFRIWKDAFGAGAPTSVPEPSTLGLAALAVFALAALHTARS